MPCVYLPGPAPAVTVANRSVVDISNFNRQYMTSAPAAKKPKTLSKN